MRNKYFRITWTVLIFVAIHCAVNVLASRYYRLLEDERKIFLGLKAIDSLTAMEYLYLESTTERAKFYEQFWQDKNTEDRQGFEQRIDYAVRQFGKFAPLTDDRIPVYVIYGPPTKREIITPQKKIGIKTKEVVKPAEVWTYNAQGVLIDFVRIGHSYKKIAQSEFGERVVIPYLKEVTIDTTITVEPSAPLNFTIGTGRFRQKKNLTRLEIYVSLDIEDTTGVLLARNVKIFNNEDEIVLEKKNFLIPQNGIGGSFFDEINVWLEPEEYRLEIELTDTKNKKIGKKIIFIDLIGYLDDAKEISDLVPATLIDKAFTHEKFHKPMGRMIPLTQPQVPVHDPFYFYTETYNLETKNGLHQLRTTYEVYNKEKMKGEVVDVMIKDWIEPGDVAYLAVEYHPMDLVPGYYIIVVRVKDLLSGKERTAVTEFELVTKE